jgi:hypothetical protein
MAMEFRDLPTSEFYDAVTSRVKDTSSQSLNYHTGILNAMKCTSSDSRMDFANRLVAQFLVVMNLNGQVDEAWRCERLLNGLKANPKYQLEANLMELLPNQTWDSITNNLRQYDRSDTNLKKESAHAAMHVVTCYTCNQPGHKSPDCPRKFQKGGKSSGRGRGGGKGGGRGFSGGRGGNHHGGTGEIRAEVEAEAKKVVKANHLIILVTFVIRQVIFRPTVRMRKNLQKCLRKEKIGTPRVTYRNEEKNMKMMATTASTA